MAQVCPISFRRIDSNIARGISSLVVLFTMLLIITQNSMFAFILLFDFVMRTLRYTHLSPFYTISKFILTGWGIAPKLCDESPKRFALYLGLGISLSLLVFYMGNFILLATIISIVLLFCALLESLFDFCIGCKIYYAIQMGKGFFNNGRNI
jgi:hypothetical protein